jgi:FAD/FMN-containing dehydrogenase
MLIEFPKGIAISTDAEALAAFARDQNVTGTHIPRAIARPANEEQVTELVRWANRKRVPLVPVSSTGERRRGDTVPAVTGTIIVDLSSMDALIHADRRDKIAIIEPGVTFGTIDDLLHPYGLRAFRPLMPRAGKSVLASHLDREPLTNPGVHWDVADPFGGTCAILGTGDRVLTGSAAIEGPLSRQLQRGHRHMVAPGPVAIDLLRVLQGAQGTLGIMTWGAVYCEPIPEAEQSWFISSDRLQPLVDLARELTHRRIGTTLFIANEEQMKLLGGAGIGAAHLAGWTLFVTAAGDQHRPADKVAWQAHDIAECAAGLGTTVNDQLGGIGADAFAEHLRRPDDSNYKSRDGGAYREVFFIQSSSRTVSTVEAALDRVMALDAERGPAVYIQPIIQGVSSHIEFTWTGAHGDEAADKALRLVIDASREAGAFFSRPYGAWKDVAFSQGESVQGMLATTKALLDPQGILNPGQIPYASAAA